MGGFSLLAQGVSALIGTGLGLLLTPGESNQGSIDYAALKRIEDEKSADAAEQRAKQAEAKRREELRVQSMYGQDIMTSDHGDDDDLTVKETVLGDKDDDREGTGYA